MGGRVLRGGPALPFQGVRTLCRMSIYKACGLDSVFVASLCRSFGLLQFSQTFWIAGTAGRPKSPTNFCLALCSCPLLCMFACSLFVPLPFSFPCSVFIPHPFFVFLQSDHAPCLLCFLAVCLCPLPFYVSLKCVFMTPDHDAV